MIGRSPAARTRLEDYFALAFVQILEAREPRVPIVVVGNKKDLDATLAEAGGRPIKREITETTARLDWECGYIECSAKGNECIIDVFKELLNVSKVRDGGRLGRACGRDRWSRVMQGGWPGWSALAISFKPHFTFFLVRTNNRGSCSRQQSCSSPLSPFVLCFMLHFASPQTWWYLSLLVLHKK